MPKTEFEHVLAKACSEPNIDIESLEVILTNARLSDIAFQIINLSHSLKGIIQIADNYHLKFDCRSEQSAEAYSEFLSNILHTYGTKYMTYIFYPGEKICEQKLKLLTKHIFQRFIILSTKDFDAEYEVLFSMAHKTLTENQGESIVSPEEKAFYMLLGCEYLLMTYADLHFVNYTSSLCHLPSIINKENFVQERAVTLYTKIIAVLERRSDMPQPEKKDLIDLYTKVRASFMALTPPSPIIMHPQAPSSPKAPVLESPTPQPTTQNKESQRSTLERKGPN